MIGPRSQDDPAVPARETILDGGLVLDFGKEIQKLPKRSQIGPKQAGSRQRRKIAVIKLSQDSQNQMIAFCKVSTYAMILTKRSIFNFYESEFIVLRALQSFVLSDHGYGLLSLESFIQSWHRSRKQTKLQGAIFGLVRRDYVQIFEQRKNGTRFIGITALGEKLLHVYWDHVTRLMEGIKLRRTQTQFTPCERRFQKVTPLSMTNLYTRSMTTKNRHLYDASKYYNEDGTIKE